MVPLFLLHTVAMKIEVVLSPTLYAGRTLAGRHVTVAVDILRATTAICAAFAAGATEIVPLDSPGELPRFASHGYLLAAERNGCKLPGATCGNSPTEYLKMDLTGQRLAYSTTNGTVSILRAADSDALFIGAFANLSALAAHLAESYSDSDLVLLCSGWKGDPSLEDTLFAGALTDRLITLGAKPEPVNDSANMALDLFRTASPDIAAYCSKATHVHRLQKLNYEADIRYALTTDTCPIVPRFRDGAIFLMKQ